MGSIADFQDLTVDDEHVKISHKALKALIDASEVVSQRYTASRFKYALAGEQPQ